MPEFHTVDDAPVVTSVEQLRSAPPGTIVITASGYRYVKKTNGRWHFQHARNTPSTWLLDPDHSAQPIRLLYRPDATTDEEA